MPGMINGMTTYRSDCQLLAPLTAAASSRAGSRLSRVDSVVTAVNGKYS